MKLKPLHLAMAGIALLALLTLRRRAGGGQLGAPTVVYQDGPTGYEVPLVQTGASQGDVWQAVGGLAGAFTDQFGAAVGTM